MGPKDIPERWEPYIPIGSPVRGTRFIAFKVPLKESICNKLAPKFRWTVDILLSSYREIGMVVDLTMTTRYYDYNDVVNKGVDYCKIPLPGRKIPPEHLVKRFFAAVDFYLDRRRDDSLIGIHCTHGVNRTGYMIARYLIQRMGYSVSDALECITVARGHPIERDNYVSNLGRNVEQLPKIMDGKDICRGRADGEERKGGASKRPADKGKEHVNRHGPARDGFRGRDSWNAPSNSVAPWEPGRGPQESREEGFHQPRRSEFVDESLFQPAPAVGYWGGGVHNPQPPGPKPLMLTPVHYVPDARREYRDERAVPLTGFNPAVPPPLSVFPQQRTGDYDYGRRPAHSEFVREEPHPWTAPQRGLESHEPPRDFVPHHSGRHSPGWGPPRQGRFSPPRQRASPPRGRGSPPRGRLSPGRGRSPLHRDRFEHRRSPPHSKMSPPRHLRMSPARGRRTPPRRSPPRRHMSPPHGHRMSPPRGSPPRRLSPPRGRRMSLPQRSRGLTPPPPPRSFRTPPPPTRRSPSRSMSPLRYRSPPDTFKPPSPKGGPMTPPYKSRHSLDKSPPRGRRKTPERHSPSRRTARRRSPPNMGVDTKYQGRQTSGGGSDHLDKKYGTDVEPFPLERSPPRSIPLDDHVDPRSSYFNRTRKSQSPFRRSESERKPISPPRKSSPPPFRRSPAPKRPLSPRQEPRRPSSPKGGKFENDGRRPGEMPDRNRRSPAYLDRNASRQQRDWKGTQDAKRNDYSRPAGDDEPVDYIDLRSASASPSKFGEFKNDERSNRLPRSEKTIDRGRPRSPDHQEHRRRDLRTLEPVETRRKRQNSEPCLDPRQSPTGSPQLLHQSRRRMDSPEPQMDRKRPPGPRENVRRRNSPPEHGYGSDRHGLRSPEPRQEHLRRGLHTREPEEAVDEYRRLRTPEPQIDRRRQRPRTPDDIRIQTPEEESEIRYGRQSAEDERRSGLRSRGPDKPPGRRVRSPEPHLPNRRILSPEPPRGRMSPDRLDIRRTPDPREDSVPRERYSSPEPVYEEEPIEPFEDPRSYGVLRTPEPLEEETRRGPSERYERGHYRDDNRYNRGGYSRGNRRPYNNYRGQMRGRGRISRGGPMRRSPNYEERAIRKPYLDDPQEFREEYHYARSKSRSRSPIVIPREIPDMDLYRQEEPDCRELLIEKRTTVAAEIGAISPTALELIGPDDEILFIGSNSEPGNSRSSSIRRRPAAARLSPRYTGRLSRSPPPKKPVFERLDDNKPPVFERLDDPLPDPRPLMEVRARPPTGDRGQSGYHPSRGFPSRPGSASYRHKEPGSSMREMGSPHRGSHSSTRGTSSHGRPPSRGTSSRGIASPRGVSSRGRISTSRGGISRGASRSTSRVLSSRPSTSSQSLSKKPAPPTEKKLAAPKRPLSTQSEGVRRPTKTAQPAARTGQSVPGKASTKIVKRAVPKTGDKPSPTKKTRGAPRIKL